MGLIDVQSDTHDLYLHSAGPSGRNRVVINPFGSEETSVSGHQPDGQAARRREREGQRLHRDVRCPFEADIRPIQGAFAKSGAARRQYAWKDADAGSDGAAPRRAGVVAQEVRAVSPELVATGAEDDAYRGVNLSGLVGTLIEAVKELAAENGALRRRIDALEDAGGEPTSAVAAG
jgi:hypothetical protein